MLAQQLANGLALGGVYALITLGFTLIFGVLRLLHVAYGDVMVLGGYLAVTAVAFFSHSFFVTMVVAVIIASALGALVERVNFRTTRNAPHIVSLISSIGMSLLIENAILLLWGPNRKMFTIDIPVPALNLSGIQLSGSRVLVILISVVVMVAMDALLRRTQLGTAIRATTIDPDTAVLMGINREFIIISSFVAGSALSGGAMVLLGSMYGVIYPTEGFMLGMKAFAAAIIGGLGSVPGAVIGGLLLGFLETLTAAYISVGYKDAIAMIVLVLVLLIRPWGLMGKPVEENI
ncbi:MAG: branched-chain amino acid ABC transporter permease [Bacillota bacterium]